jgi:hypothetical protein
VENKSKSLLAICRRWRMYRNKPTPVQTPAETAKPM